MADMIQCDNCGQSQRRATASYFEVAFHAWALTLGSTSDPAHLCSPECMVEWGQAGMVPREHREAASR